METISLSVKDAEEFLKNHDRHYKVSVDPICAIGIGDVSKSAGLSGTETHTRLHGAAILGRRADGDAELAHIYVDGSFQGYSILYGACWRALKALGYKRAWL